MTPYNGTTVKWWDHKINKKKKNKQMSSVKICPVFLYFPNQTAHQAIYAASLQNSTTFQM
jgi:hypothetical protein